MNKKLVTRNTGIDLLKILLAIMVISIHFCAPATGNVTNNCEQMPMKLFLIGLMGLAYPAVNCYILITSYFVYGQKKTLENIIYSLSKIWIALITFSVLGYLATCIIQYQSFSVLELIKRFFPIIRGEWWFMSVYFALMISMPFLLKFIDSINVGTHRQLMIICFITCSCFPFFTKYEDVLGLEYGYSYLWFVVLFLIGTYLKRVNISERCKPFQCFVWYVMFGIFNEAIALFTSRIPFLHGFTTGMYNSFVVCIQSVFLFLAFINIQFNKNEVVTKVVGTLASLSMASYIFHCQEDIGSFFWEKTNPSAYANSYSLFSIYTITVLGLYMVSVLLELIRRKLMGLGNLEYKIICKINKVISCGYKKVDSFVKK